MKTQRQLFLIFIVFLSLTQTPKSFANPVIEIDKIVIAKPKKQLSLPQSSQNIRFENNTTEWNTSLSENLSRQSGLHVQKYGGIEANTAISIRGSNQQHVQIFWDGIPLENAANQGINLNQISLNQISKIEIFKSFSPVELGNSNQSGTISIQSKAIQKNWHGSFGYQYGSFNTSSAFANLSFGGKKNRFSLGLDFLTTDGDFDFVDNNGTPLNFTDDQTTARQNNYNTTWHPQLKWQWDINENQTLTFLSHFFAVKRGIPGFENFQSEKANLNLLESISSLKWQFKPHSQKKWSFENQIYGRWILSEFSDPDGEIGLGAAQDNKNTTVIVGNKFLAAHKISDKFSYKILSHYTFETFSPKDNLSNRTSGTVSQRHQIQMAFEPNLLLWQNSLDVSAKIHSILAFYDINNDDPSLNNPATFFSQRTEFPLLAAINLKKQLGESIFLKTSVARDVRLPKFTEMFGDQGYVLGNPELTSEKNIQWDFGLVFQKPFSSFIKKIRFEISYFENYASDLIEFEIINGLARANNIGSSRVRGLESFFHIEAKEYFAANLNYTFLNAKDTTQTERFLIGRPKHEVNASLHFQHKGFSVINHVNWIDDKFLNSLNTKSIQNRLRLDSNISYTFANKHTLGFEIKNLTNSQIVDAVGFPLPGRSFFLSWKSQI